MSFLFLSFSHPLFTLIPFSLSLISVSISFYLHTPYLLLPSLLFCCRLNFGIPLSHLPRESRLCFTLHGLESTMSTENPWKLCPIAWVTQRLFTSEGVLIFGPKLLGLWAGDCADPLDSPYCNVSSSKSVLLEVAFEESDERVMCDVSPSKPPPTVTSPAPKPDVRPSRSSLTSPAPKPVLPPSINRGLKKMADRDRFSRYILIPIVNLGLTA